MRLQVRARGKINWSLDVVGQREDGYHLLDMVMSSVTLCDLLTLDSADNLSLSVSGESRRFVPAREGNLVLTAARALQSYAGTGQGARMHLRKFLPVGAGMGGGSADAAAVLIALNQLWGLHLPAEELEKVGLSVGADVPFCIRGGFARVQGIGEVLNPLPLEISYPLLVTQPCRGLSTREVFTSLHEDGIDPSDRPDNETLIAALQTGNLPEADLCMGNVLEPVSRRKRPALDGALQDLRGAGAVAARMTGSGSAVFGVFENMAALSRAKKQLGTKYPDLRAMRTAAQGVTVEEVKG